MAFVVPAPGRRSARAPTNITGINWASPLARGLVAAWLPVTGSLLADISRLSPAHDTGNSIPPAYLSNGLLGVQRTSVGNDDISAVGAPWDTPSITIAAWVQTPAVSDIQMICAREAAGFGLRIFQFRIDATGTPQFISNIYAAPTSIDFRTATTQVDDGHPHLVVATFEDSVRTAISVDGVVESETSRSGALGQNSSRPLALLFQNRTDRTFWATGHVGAILMWNRGFADAELAALYNPQTRWDIIDQGDRFIPISIPAGGGGYTATMAAAMAALDASLAARVGRKAIIEGATAGVDVSGTLLADVHRTGVLVAGAAASAVKFADLTRTGPLQASVTLSADLQAKAHRKATLTGATAETASLTGNIVMPSWTLNSIDSTHHVTDGPRINAAILDYASGSSYIVIEGAGRQLKSSSSGYAAQARSDIEIPANKLLYAECEKLDTVTTGAGFGVVNTSYSFLIANYYWVAGSIGVAYRFDGEVYRNNSSLATYTAPSVNDVLQLAFNEATGKIWFGLNGTFNGDPAAGTGEAATMTSGPWSVALATGSTPIMGIVNFGQRDWAHTPPSGFSGLGDF